MERSVRRTLLLTQSRRTGREQVAEGGQVSGRGGEGQDVVESGEEGGGSSPAGDYEEGGGKKINMERRRGKKGEVAANDVEKGRERSMSREKRKGKWDVERRERDESEEWWEKEGMEGERADESKVVGNVIKCGKGTIGFTTLRRLIKLIFRTHTRDEENTRMDEGGGREREGEKMGRLKDENGRENMEGIDSNCEKE